MGAKSGKLSRNAVKKVKENYEPDYETSGNTRMSQGVGMSRRSEHSRRVTMVADPEKEHTYSVAPQEVVVNHAAGEPLGGTFLQVNAKDLPGMPEVPRAGIEAEGSMLISEDGSMRVDDTSDQQLAIVTSILPDGPVAQHNAHGHACAVVVGTVILAAKQLSETSTSLTIGRWGWSVVIEEDKGAGLSHPGASVEEHSSFARITDINPEGTLSWKNERNRHRCVRKGDCVVSVNGIPVSRWVEGPTGCWSTSQMLNSYISKAGSRQEWVVVRVPGTKSCSGGSMCDDMILWGFSGSDLSAVSTSATNEPESEASGTCLTPRNPWQELLQQELLRSQQQRDALEPQQAEEV